MKRYPTMIALAMLFAASAAAQEGDATNLAKAAQNPIADMISVPLQYNINFDTGPLGGTQHLVNIQPVYPVKLNADWNVITRTIVPVISQPAFAAGQDREFGIGDIQFSAFLSPTEAGGRLDPGRGRDCATGHRDQRPARARGLGPRDPPPWH